VIDPVPENAAPTRRRRKVADPEVMEVVSPSHEAELVEEPLDGFQEPVNGDSTASEASEDVRETEAENEQESASDDDPEPDQEEMETDPEKDGNNVLEEEEVDEDNIPF